MHVIRAINAGAKLNLLIWQVTVDGKEIVVFGCRVDDNAEDPNFAYGACRNSNELEDLLRLLKEKDFSLQLHNELRLPILARKRPS